MNKAGKEDSRARRASLFSRAVLAFSIAAAAAAAIWAHGAALAAVDAANGETPAAMAGRENALDSFRRSAYRLWMRLALPPEDLAAKERFAR